MKFDKYFVNGFDNFLITTFLVVIVYIIIYLSINKKIEAFNKTRPNHAVSIPFVSSAVRVAYFLLSFVIIAYQILPFRPVLDLMMDASGILAICVTFAARESFSNYIAGFLLTIHKPFIIGDKISIQDPKIKGIVKDITFRHTTIESENGNIVTVPNSIMNTVAVEDISKEKKTTRKKKDSVTR